MAGTNRAQRRADVSRFRRQSRSGCATYLFDARTKLTDAQGILRDAVVWWRANFARRNACCIGCKAAFTDAGVAAGAFFCAIPDASPGEASVSALCEECWLTLSDDELQKTALRIAKQICGPGARFVP